MFFIKKGEIFGIIGYSGVGKSFLICLLNGFEKLILGIVEVVGIKINEVNGCDLRNVCYEISMIF